MVTAEEEDTGASREVMWRGRHRCGILKQELPSLKSKHYTKA